MKQIKEINIEGDRIFLKKGNLFGWRVVYPYKIDGEINWKNLICGGSWLKLFIVFLIVLITLGCIYEYSIALKIANDCLAHNKLFTLLQ